MTEAPMTLGSRPVSLAPSGPGPGLCLSRRRVRVGLIAERIFNFTRSFRPQGGGHSTIHKRHKGGHLALGARGYTWGQGVHLGPRGTLGAKGGVHLFSRDTYSIRACTQLRGRAHLLLIYIERNIK